MSKDEERLAFAGRVIFYGVVFMTVYAFYLTGAE